MAREYLLFTDTHLDDVPANEYRWRVFDRVNEILDSNPDIQKVFCLGDAWDRKDRFSGQFVNRLVGKVSQLGAKRPTWILKGNHDDPLKGPAFFEFINDRVPNVRYVTSPTTVDDIILLPFTPDPITAWKGINFSKFKAAMMHITVTGAISESGFTLTGGKMPILPRGLTLYSGDVHNPQTVRNLTYVGCPHPVKFGDDFQPRMLIVDAETLEVSREVPIKTMRKISMEITSLDELRSLKVAPGDQVKVRVGLTAANVEDWAEIERGIAEWASANKADVASVEASIDTGVMRDGLDLDRDPSQLLREFAVEESLSNEMLNLGLDIIREVC